MFLKNFKMIQQAQRFAGDIGAFQNAYLLKDINGQSCQVNGATCADFGVMPKSFSYNNRVVAQEIKNGSRSNIVAGTSTAAVTEDDYTLKVPSGLVYVSSSNPSVYADSDNMMHVVYSVSYMNESTATITLTEWGIKRSTHTTASASTPFPILIFRELFADPVVLPPKASFAFSADFTIGPAEP